MDIHDLLLDLSTPEKEAFVKATSKALGRPTSLGYMRKLAGGRCMPSIQMAKALIAASAKLRPPSKQLDMDSFIALRKKRQKLDNAAELRKAKTR